jgi:CHAT domain-containing protein
MIFEARSAIALLIVCSWPLSAFGDSATVEIPSARVSALWGAADTDLVRGNLRQAERALTEAGAVATSDLEKVGTALRLGTVLTQSGREDDAAQELARAETLLAASPQSSSTTRFQLYQAQARLAARKGNFERAEALYETAATEATLADADVDVAQSKLNALRARLDARNIAGLEQRLVILHAQVIALPASEESAKVMIGTGDLHRRAVNEFQASTVLRQNAFNELQRGWAYATTETTRATAAGMLGALYMDEGRIDEAEKLTAQAVFMAQSADAADQLYRWEWQAGQIDRSRGDLQKAAEALDRSLASLADIRGDVLQSSRTAYRDRIEPLYLDYADVRLRQAAALVSGSPDEQHVLREVRHELETLKQTEIRDYFQDTCVTAEGTGTERGFSIPGVAVIYPILLADRIEVIIETDGVLRRSSAQVSRGQATAVARRMRIGLEKPSAGEVYLEPAQSLYRWLLGDAEPWLAEHKIKTLVFVPSGALRTIPMAALHDGNGFLIERYAIATTPAVSLVTTLRPPAFEQLFVAGLTESVQGFPALPAVGDEMRAVSAAFPAEAFANSAFQLATVQSELATKTVSVAHLATHGEFSADHRQSFVLTYDDRLTMNLLQTALGMRVESPLDLLVLSACKTASGDDRAALGLAGVAVQAGANSALASLWYISDAATADLMGRFYRNLTTAGTTKAASLRDAQVALLNSVEFKHPSYWAPYLLIGNWL